MSIIKNTYGQYFSEINKLPDDIQDASVTFKIGNKDYAAKIEDGLFITIENLPMKYLGYLTPKELTGDDPELLSYDQIIRIFEGYSFDEGSNIMESSKKHPPTYTMTDIDNWTRLLFDPIGDRALKFLKEEKGLSKDSIEEYKIGYDSKSKSIIVPYINFTGEGVSEVKRYELTEDGNSFEEEINRPDLMLGYHDILISTYNLGRLFLATDELEAILLRQFGYHAIGPYFSSIDGWLGMLKQFHMLVYREQEINYYNWNIGEPNRIPLTLSLVKIDTESIAELVKNGIDKKGIDEKIEERIQINSVVYEAYRNIDDLEKKLTTAQSVFPQFLFEDVQHYGIVGSENLHIISSERIFRLAYEVSLSGPDISHVLLIPPYQISNFSPTGVKKYTTENYTPTSLAAFNLVKNFLKDFIYFPNEGSYTFISIWIIGTYLFKNFDYYPYMHINAPKGSGKSTLLEVLENLCFNSKFYVDPTPAVVFREIELYQPTLLLDEVEDFKNNSSKRDLLSLLNQGFSQRSNLPRVTGKDITYYNMYCPKAFAGINKINDVLLSRSIKVNMVKKPQLYKLKNSYKDPALINRIQEICDEIYIFGLYYAKKINENYKNVKKIPELSDVFNREMDTWGPIFSMAQLIDKDNTSDKTTSELRTCLESDRTAKKEEMDSSENEIAHLLSDYFQTTKKLRFTKEGALVYDISTLFGAAKKEGVLSKEIATKNKFTSYLKNNYNFDNPVVDVNGNKKRRYTFQLEELVNKLVEFGVNVTEDDFKL